MLEFHMTLRTLGAVAFALGCFITLPAMSEEIQVKALNRAIFVFLGLSETEVSED